MSHRENGLFGFGILPLGILQKNKTEGSTEESRTKEIMNHPILPHARNFAGKLGNVSDKILPVSDEVCWRCYQNWDSHCMAYLVSGSDEEYDYRKKGNAVCEYIKYGRSLPIADKFSGKRKV